MRRHPDVERAVVAALACALTAALVPLEVVRIVAALPLALFMPGWAIVAAAFAGSEPVRAVRWTLSIGISLCVLALGAVLLNAFSFGLTTASWAVLLVAVVFIAGAAAAARRGPASGGRPTRSPARISLREAAPLAAAALVAVGALVLAQRPLPAKHALGFTALWVLPENARQEAVVVGVLSSEQDPTSYVLRVSRSGAREPKAYGLRLEPGQERTFRVAAPHRAGASTRVTASLYESDRPGRVYRRVTTWLPRRTTFP